VEEGFGELGGAPFLADVRAAHKRYGEALAIKKAQAPIREVPSVREPLDGVLAALRKYVLQVVAHGERNEEAKEQASRLLAPLAEWPSVQTKPTTQQVAPPVTTPPVPTP
jgi:hypothetical protein